MYLLYKSKAEIKTVSGVSSIIRETQQHFSKVVIFLHSLPISFHFKSSLGICISVIVTSLVTSEAYCWIAFKMISLASSFLLSSICCLCLTIKSFQSFSNFILISFKNSSLASSTVSLDISSSFQSNSIFFFSNSSFFLFIASSFLTKLSCLFSTFSIFLSSFSSFSKTLVSAFSVLFMISKLSFLVSSNNLELLFSASFSIIEALSSAFLIWEFFKICKTKKVSAAHKLALNTQINISSISFKLIVKF